ncbi:MAG: hypothetical protein GY940_17745 [bacterium]|nr:hypothetical protein [bacterium]
MKINFTRILILFITILIVMPPLFPQPQQKEIIETVGVNWWLVPVLATDGSGAAVMDLKKEDLQLKVNNRIVTNFTLIHHTLDSRKTETAAVKPAPPGTFQPGKRVVVLLFDLTLTDDMSIGRAKDIAGDIITGGDDDTRFVLITLEPFGGLKFIAEGSGKTDKVTLLKHLKTKVTKRKNPRHVWDVGIYKPLPGRDSEEEMTFFAGQAGNYLKRKTIPFFQSFETLYFYLNTIRDSKFVYFFSSGLPDSIRRNIVLPGMGVKQAKGTSFYDYYSKRVADYLGRSGAVLLMVNPMGVLRAGGSEYSGRTFLKNLANQSGGAYMEGTGAGIVQKAANIHHGFYEVVFPNKTVSKDGTLNISVTSRRKGIKINSIRTIEKTKGYGSMSDLEKEMLVLNLVSNPNPMTQSRLSAYGVSIDKVKKSKGKEVFHITLPPAFLNRSLDLWKVTVKHGKDGAGVEAIEKETVQARKKNFKVRFNWKKSKPGKKDAYFVLVDPSAGSARVHGAGLYDDDPELVLLREQRAAAKIKRKSGKTIPAAELNALLAGAADYCDKLKQSAFHFFCKESIMEKRTPLGGGRNVMQARNPTTMTAMTGDRDSIQMPSIPKREVPADKLYVRVKNHQLSYRLIKNGPRIKEERDWYADDPGIKVPIKQVIDHSAFFSQKAVFAPITLLDRSRQTSYKYTFLRNEKWKGRPAIVIEAVPKKNAKVGNSIYGDIWIDREDFSILKIKAAPQSIRGYSQLKALAKKMRSKLYLSLDTEFATLNNGIRFPTSVSSLEKYKGGPIISRQEGAEGWERTRTVFTYSDYQFFRVKTEVTVK